MTQPDPGFTGLSCYTANLAAYLAAGDDRAAARFADSVRLAVRVDAGGGEPAFSHHRFPLDRLPDGTRLRYAVDPTPDALDAELAAHGRVVVVVDNARLPWSPSFGTDHSAPHWLLVLGREGDRWHVVDHFAGLLPTGEQHPHDGDLSTVDLMRAVDGPPALSPAQQRRGELVFGFAVAMPAGRRLWLRREPDDGGPDRLPGEWLTAGALPLLAERFRTDPLGWAAHLDDLWTAAGHHVFRYRRAGLSDAADAWRQLPGALRFAVDSARRGKPRASLVDLTFRNLIHVESGQEAFLASAGRTAP